MNRSKKKELRTLRRHWRLALKELDNLNHHAYYSLAPRQRDHIDWLEAKIAAVRAE